MALTRKLLKSMGLSDEQVETVIEAHTDTVDGLKNELSGLKDKANASKYRISRSELNETINQLESYQELLKKYNKENG